MYDLDLKPFWKSQFLSEVKWYYKWF